MTIEELDNTPSRWRNDGVEIPVWVAKHLALLLDVKRLHGEYIAPQVIEV